MPKIPLNVVADALEDEAALKCRSCSAVPDEGEIYCLHCRLYWDEVDNGLFSDAEWEERHGVMV